LEVHRLGIESQCGNEGGHRESDPGDERDADYVFKMNTIGQTANLEALTQPACAGNTDKFSED
jgi:hypothetical protein